MIVKITAILLLASAVNLAMRNASAAFRHLVWCAALAAALLLPIFGAFAPHIAAPALVILATAAPTRAAAAAAPTAVNGLLLIYFAGLVAMLFRLVRDIASANALVRSASSPSEQGVRVASQATVPFVWGFRRAAIVVPPDFEALTEARRTAVLAHENEHIARHDVLTMVAAELVRAVYWFHPLAWWAAQQLRLEADRACDDAVLRRGFSGDGYASDLVGIARAFRSAALAPGAIQLSQLEVRIRHILSGTAANRRALGTAAVCAAALACLAIAYPLGALSQEKDTKVYKIADGIEPPTVAYKVEPEYTPEAKADHIEGTAILSVVIGADGSPRDVVVVKGINEGLDRNAVAAIINWRFNPGKKDGNPVAVQATIEMNFKLM
jgi:TonB family protein